MFRPSAAPRWKMEIRIFFFPSPGDAARTSHDGRQACSGYGDRGCANEIASSEHGYLLWNSGELRTMVASIDGVASLP